MFEAILLLAGTAALSLWGTGNMFLLLAFPLLFLCCLPGIRAMVSGNPPFVPTPRRIADSMFRLARVRRGERIFDLGCGDGRLVIAAAKRGARATGYEISLPTCAFAKLRSLRQPGARILFGDFWKQDYAQVDVIFCFLLRRSMARFEREIWPHLKVGCRVVSHTFRMPNVAIAGVEGEAVLYRK